jgi:hypothetical protein
MPRPSDLIQNLPERWQSKLADYLSAKGRAQLSAGDFPSNGLMIRFPDDSEARFRFAFALRDDDCCEIAVFTEHCGYHVFPSFDTIVEVISDD